VEFRRRKFLFDYEIWDLVSFFSRHFFAYSDLVDQKWPVETVAKWQDMCGGVGLLGVEVRKSVDGGRSWSYPVTVIMPQPNTPWECTATDGGAFYDEDQKTWHYLFQCLDRNLVWDGCHLEFHGADPTLSNPSNWTGSRNPVIRSGDLWSKICSNPSAVCRKLPLQFANYGLFIPNEEGTFDIFQKKNGYYYVSFHGYDGVNGYRGIAKTADWIHWIAGQDDLPQDAIFNPLVATNWRENWQGWRTPNGVWINHNLPVGGGAGGIFYEAPYYYLVVECADINLGCADGQNWDVGILRAADLRQAPWDSFAQVNPIFYSSRDFPSDSCNCAYNRIFQAPNGVLYLSQHRSSGREREDGIFIYTLAYNAGNALQNWNLWKCNGENWGRIPVYPTNIAIYRSILFAFDYNCYLAFNCGDGNTPCNQAQSIYQDVNAGQWGFLPGKKVTFGGEFAVYDNSSNNLQVVAWQINSNGQALTNTIVNVVLNEYWRFVQGYFTVVPNCSTVRFQLYPQTAGVTFRADNMFLQLA
jgi:hypothetical protein